MKQRKYLSEFGLNVYTSHKYILPIEHLKFEKDNRKYHIYSILSSQKVRYVKDSFKTTEKHLSFILEIQKMDSFERIEVNRAIISNHLDHRNIILRCNYPYNNLEIEIDKDIAKDQKRVGFILSAHDALGIFVDRVCEFEVLYIGQAFGKDGERIATDRLQSHSTLQKILTDYYSSHPDKQLHVALFEFTPQIHASFDGLTRKDTATNQEENDHLNDVISNPLKYNQIINITEAAMINYFKPTYNKDFVDNFPDAGHKGYRQYYDLDYNILVVEIDLEFDTAGLVQLSTATNRINSSFDYIQYELFNDPNRKSMFDIFNCKKMK